MGQVWKKYSTMSFILSNKAGNCMQYFSFKIPFLRKNEIFASNGTEKDKSGNNKTNNLNRPYFLKWKKNCLKKICKVFTKKLTILNKQQY